MPKIEHDMGPFAQQGTALITGLVEIRLVVFLVNAMKFTSRKCGAYLEQALTFVLFLFSLLIGIISEG